MSYCCKISLNVVFKNTVCQTFANVTDVYGDEGCEYTDRQRWIEYIGRQLKEEGVHTFDGGLILDMSQVIAIEARFHNYEFEDENEEAA